MILPLLLACAPAVDPAPGAPRWVSLTPAITETIAALGREDVLVGRSEWCELPPSVTPLPPVGSALTPELERIARLHPTTIVVDGSEGVDTRALGHIAPVTVLPWLTVPQVADSVERLGEALDREAAAAALAARFRALDVPPPEDGPEVLLTMTEDPRQGDIWYVRPDSLHGSILHAAGGRNALPEPPTGAPTLSVEGLLALDPDAIVVLTPREVDDTVRAQILANWAPLTPLSAVAGGRVRVLGGPTVMPTGPSLLATTETLRAELATLP